MILSGPSPGDPYCVSSFLFRQSRCSKKQPKVWSSEKLEAIRRWSLTVAVIACQVPSRSCWVRWWEAGDEMHPLAACVGLLLVHLLQADSWESEAISRRMAVVTETNASFTCMVVFEALCFLNLYFASLLCGVTSLALDVWKYHKPKWLPPESK